MIIAVLLGLILGTLLFGPVAGVLLAIAAAAMLIPGVGGAIGGAIFLGVLIYLFGVQATLIGIPLVMLAIYLYALYENKKTLDSIYEEASKKPAPKVNHPRIESEKDLIEQLSIYKEEYLIVNEKSYHFIHISCKWQQEHIEIFNKGKSLGFKEYSRTEFTDLNNKISAFKKAALKSAPMVTDKKPPQPNNKAKSEDNKNYVAGIKANKAS